MTNTEACALLGVSFGASHENIKKSFTALIMQHHPDRGGSVEMAAMLNVARDKLLAIPEVPAGTQFASWDPTEDQARAFAGIIDWVHAGQFWKMPYLTVGGLGGTGKTSLAGHVARQLQAEGKRLAFATLTGRAAGVLAASLAAAGVIPYSIGTIHKLMYRPHMDQMTGRVLGWSKADVIDADLIVVDEASMVSTEMFRDILSYGVPVLAIGDHGQLMPVDGNGSVMEDPHFRLEKIHRQAAGNPVIELAMKFRNGVPLKKILEWVNTDVQGRVIWQAGREGMFEAIDFAGPNPPVPEGGLTVGKAIPGLIISFTNRMRCGTNNLTRQVLKRNGAPEVGEMVICVKNAYLPHGLLANGARAIIVDAKLGADDHSYDLVIDAGDGRDPFPLRASSHQFGRAQTFKGFDEVPGRHYSWESVGTLLDFGYCLTAHKSQGSQAPNVAVLLEKALKVLTPEDFRRWSYTAVSRATEKVMLVTDV